MSKLIAAATATLGGTATAVGGSYLLKNGSGTGTVNSTKTTLSGKGTPPSTPEIKPSSPDADISPKPTDQNSSTASQQNFEFETLEAFKSNMKSSKCVKEYFGDGIADKPNATKISESAPTDGVFFKTTHASTDPYKSCLTVERKVNNYSTDSKGSGKFTWLWAFVRGDEGFITFNVAETSDQEAGKLKFSGIFYLVGQTDDNSGWEIKYRHEPKSNIVADSKSKNIDTYFPKAGDDLKNSVEGDYGGFIDNAEKLNEACKTGECGSADASGPKFISKKLTGTSGTDQTKKLSGGSSVSTWGSNIYESSSWNLENKIGEFYGTGAVDNSQAS